MRRRLTRRRLVLGAVGGLGLLLASALIVLAAVGTHDTAPTDRRSQRATPHPVPSAPSFAGWPNAETTGVPEGAQPLQKHGDLTVTLAGAYYTRLDIEGCVTVEADNVTITQSVIHCARTRRPAVQVRGGKNLILDQVEVDGGGQADSCVATDNFTIYRSNLHDCKDGIDFSSNVVIDGNYIHDLARSSGSHNDALQTLGGTDDIVRNNTLQSFRADTHDPMNAAIQTGRLKRSLTNVLIEHNYMDGGNYTVNAGSPPAKGTVIEGYVFRNNVFGRDYRYGPVRAVGDGTVFDASNVWADDGQPVRTND